MNRFERVVLFAAFVMGLGGFLSTHYHHPGAQTATGEAPGRGGDWDDPNATWRDYALALDMSNAPRIGAAMAEADLETADFSSIPQLLTQNMVASTVVSLATMQTQGSFVFKNALTSNEIAAFSSSGNDIIQEGGAILGVIQDATGNLAIGWVDQKNEIMRVIARTDLIGDHLVQFSEAGNYALSSIDQ